MVDAKIRLARLKKIKKKNIALEALIDTYLKMLRETSWIIIKNSKQDSRLITVTFDENVLSLESIFKLMIALELLFHYIPSPKKDRHDKLLEKNYRALNDFGLDHNVNTGILNNVFPYHIKHPYLVNLSAIIGKIDSYGIKQLLYPPEQRTNINRFMRNADKVHCSLIRYMNKLYNYYAKLSIVKTALRPLVNKELVATDGDIVFTPELLPFDERYQGVVSDYSNAKKIRMAFFRQLYDSSELGKHFVGHFWKLNHSAVIGYWYEVVLFFDAPSIAIDHVLSNNLLSLSADSSYYIEPFKRIDRFDLEERIAVMKLMDSYLKLKPFDASTAKAYPNDRIFGKAQFRPNNPRPSSVKKSPDWQPL